jgi:hypothetical protein
VKPIILGLLALLLSAGPAVSQTVDDKLIVPGVRIGKWTLQATIDDLVRMNGPAQTLSEDDPDFVRGINEFHWQKPGLSLTAITFDRHKVDVLLFDAAPIGATVYKTDRGIGFLSTRQEVLRLYGQPTIARAARMLGRTNMIYDSLGINFQVDESNNGLVALVAIFRPTIAKSIWKF